MKKQKAQLHCDALIRGMLASTFGDKLEFRDEKKMFDDACLEQSNCEGFKNFKQVKAVTRNL